MNSSLDSIIQSLEQNVHITVSEVTATKTPRKWVDGNSLARVTRVLNCFDKTFPHKTGELNNDSWITNLYLVTSDLLNKYVMKGREKDLHDFYVHFWIEAEVSKRKRQNHQNSESVRTSCLL